MAACVVKKVFSGYDSPDTVLKDVAEFLSGTWRNGQTVEVRLCVSGRLKKRDAREILGKAVKERPRDWEHGSYNFLFSPETAFHRFFWHGRQVHITVAEGLFLFRRVVLEEISDSHTLRNIRKRLGKDFLKDMESVKNLPPDYNVDCAFPNNHERNKDKPEGRLLKERRKMGLV